MKIDVPADLQGTEELVSVLQEGDAGEPYTSRDIADELGCARTTAYRKLQRLAEAGVLDTKKVGARARVWWVPPAVAGREPEPPPESSEGRREYEELAASEQQFRAVFEEAFDAMLIADDDARYVDANPAACELLGLPREELLGRTVADFAADGYDFETAWRDFQESGLDRGLFPLVRADGEPRLVEFAATPDILPGRHLSVLRDVTEERETKTALADERERAREYQRTLAADTVVQLEIRLADDDFVCNRLSGELDCSCELEGVVSTADGRLLEYVTVDGAPPEAVRAAAASSADVTGFRVVHESDGTTLVEFALARSPVQTLAEAGASSRSMRSTRGVTTVVAEYGADADYQRLGTEFKRAYPDAEIVAKRSLNRPIVTTRQYRESLAGTLTERQQEVFRAAYLGGYFEWPRNSRAETIASAMGIAASTWLQHLRFAERKIARWYFEELEE